MVVAVAELLHGFCLADIFMACMMLIDRLGNFTPFSYSNSVPPSLFSACILPCCSWDMPMVLIAFTLALFSRTPRNDCTKRDTESLPPPFSPRTPRTDGDTERDTEGLVSSVPFISRCLSSCCHKAGAGASAPVSWQLVLNFSGSRERAATERMWFIWMLDREASLRVFRAMSLRPRAGLGWGEWEWSGGARFELRRPATGLETLGLLG